MKEERGCYDNHPQVDKPRFMSRSMREALEAEARRQEQINEYGEQGYNNDDYSDDAYGGRDEPESYSSADTYGSYDSYTDGDRDYDRSGYDSSYDDETIKTVSMRKQRRSRDYAYDEEDDENETPAPGEENRAGQWKWYLKSLLSVVIPLLVIALAIWLSFTYWLTAFEVQRSSMAPTLRDGDTVIFHSSTNIKHGDIIAFVHDEMVLVKRVIALGGDTISISANGEITLNGDPLIESYVSGTIGEHRAVPQVSIPDDHYYVMGDQRSTSIDSRDEEIGTIRQEQVIGKYLLRIWPFRR